jgi:hypothetical protein
MSSHRRFPWEVVVGILGVTVAALCVYVFIGPRDDFDVVIFNGQVLDGPADGVFPTTLVLVLAGVFGGGGLIALLAFYRRALNPPRVDERVLGDRP